MSRLSKHAAILTLIFCFALTAGLRAQTATGMLDFTARVTPTAARPEPVRQFTFYVLTKSYEEIAKEVEAQDALVPRDKFIDDLGISPELKTWLKAHDILDLTLPDLDKVVTPTDIIQTPEFLMAYQRSNSGGVTSGLPRPKYSEADKTANPERYERQKQEYLATLKKFMQAHPESVNGIELELSGVNPQTKWAKLENDHRRRVARLAPEVAQTKYLAAKADTDLDGHATVSGLPEGDYWISTLNLDAAAGDARLRWDVRVTVRPGQTRRVELTNLNGTDARATAP
jgi:hypothetical protein